MREERPFELHISQRLDELWCKLGISADSRANEMERLAKSLERAYHRFVDSVEAHATETEAQIKEIQHKHIQSMRAFGYTPSEITEAVIDPIEQPLLQRLEHVRSSYEGFQKACADRITEMENLLAANRELYDALGVPESERGEFAELGDTDLTRERMARIRKNIEVLKTEKAKRMEKVAQLKEKIIAFSTELGVPVECDVSLVVKECVVTESAIASLEECCRNLEKLRAERVREISRMAVSITHLWNLLGVREDERQQFLARHSTLGLDVVESCRNEIERLTKVRDANIDTLIEAEILELKELWEYLNVPPAERMPITDDMLERFDQMEEEILKWKQYAMENHEILEQINAREQIIRCYEVIRRTEKTRLLSKTHESALRVSMEEKARKEYRFNLPKIERKLEKLLLDYKARNNNDFIWGGEPYIKRITRLRRKKGLNNSASKFNCSDFQNKSAQVRRAKSPAADTRHRCILFTNKTPMRK